MPVTLGMELVDIVELADVVELTSEEVVEVVDSEVSESDEAVCRAASRGRASVRTAPALMKRKTKRIAARRNDRMNE